MVKLLIYQGKFLAVVTREVKADTRLVTEAKVLSKCLGLANIIIKIAHIEILY